MTSHSPPTRARLLLGGRSIDLARISPRTVEAREPQTATGPGWLVVTVGEHEQRRRVCVLGWRGRVARVAGAEETL